MQYACIRGENAEGELADPTRTIQSTTSPRRRADADICIPQDQTIIEREARTYAETFANRTCPRGYNFYGDSPVGSSKRGEHTYTFQCTQ